MTSPAPWRRRFDAPNVSFPGWARDRPEHAVYSSNATGKWELYAWDVAAGEHRRLTDRPEGTRGAVLDPGGERVWWFDDDRGNEFGRWAVQPFAGGPARPAAPGLPDAYPAGLLVGAGLTVIGSSLADASTAHVVRPDAPPRQIYRHEQLAWAAALSHDETLVALVHSERGDSRHPAVRIVDLEGRTVGEIDDGPALGVEARAWSPLAGDQRLLISHERSGSERPAIWSLATGAVQDLPLDLPGEVWADWYPDARTLLIGHSHHARDELYRLDLASGRLSPLEVPRGTIAAARVRPDGELWYQRSDAATPPEVAGRAGPLLRPAGEQAPSGVPYSDIWAGQVHAFLAQPAGDGPRPTVFYVHGGPESQVPDAFSPSVQAWVDHGFAAVMVNYRGSTGYGREWRDALTGRPGLTELEDIAAVYDQLVEAGVTDPRRAVIHGRSWGGYLTLLGLGVQPDRWALGLAGVPVADYVAAYEDEMDPLKAYDRALFGGTPEEIPDVYRERSPITYVDRVRVPVLILAGEHDPRCPIRQIDNYLARLRELDKPHEVHRYEAGHSSLKTEEAIRQQELMLDFCARHLGTPAPA